jgi:hypothetical protein
MLDGEVFVSEEILLPFASEPSGTVPILARVNFTESQFMRIKSIPQVTGNPLDHKLISLAETE